MVNERKQLAWIYARYRDPWYCAPGEFGHPANLEKRKGRDYLAEVYEMRRDCIDSHSKAADEK